MASSDPVAHKINEMQNELTKLSSALRQFQQINSHTLPFQGDSNLQAVRGWLLSAIESYMVISKLTNTHYSSDVNKLKAFIANQDFKISVMPAYKQALGEAANLTVNAAKSLTEPFRR